MRKIFLGTSLGIIILFIVLSLKNPIFIYSFYVIIPMILVGLIDMFQSKQSIRRNFPLIGNFRYLFEMIRPEINQYFVESNIDGKPFSREERSVVYQRSKRVTDSLPFGTQGDVYKEGYEFVPHSLRPTHVSEESLRVKIGGQDCVQPYLASIFNISAMSYGSLSKNAVLALNGGAKEGNFAHNTGEGGISPYHLQNGGDLIWQIGTGYFGCRTKEGTFDSELFKKNASHSSVKMIEIKLSQGAKPGHGGILPKGKVTKEISLIRNVPMGKDVLSPPGHSAFSNPKEMLEFIKNLRTLSGGKPIGIKLCVGREEEFISLCKAMIELNIKPDYIAVDGGEGGTGAAPLEFSNSIGMPGMDGIIFVINTLRGFNLKNEIKVLASGKLTTGFGLIRLLCLGVDACYAARSFMLSLGCIQALRCHTNECPAGVATQEPSLIKGLVVKDKLIRVKNFHQMTLKNVAEILGAMGLESHTQLKPTYLKRRINHFSIQSYAELVDWVTEGELLNQTSKKFWQEKMLQACTDKFSI